MYAPEEFVFSLDTLKMNHQPLIMMDGARTRSDLGERCARRPYYLKFRDMLRRGGGSAGARAAPRALWQFLESARELHDFSSRVFEFQYLAAGARETRTHRERFSGRSSIAPE
jgi:hypothetical protein